MGLELGPSPLPGPAFVSMYYTILRAKKEKCCFGMLQIIKISMMVAPVRGRVAV